MIKLTTEVKVQNSNYRIGYDDYFFLMGSCFADSVKERLDHYQFHNFSNPFGVVYNPASLAQSVERIAKMNLFTKDNVIECGELYNSLFHHTSFARNTPDEFLNNANRALAQAHDYLQKATVAVFTFGTAWYYRYNSTGIIASNCNKLNPNLFTRSILSVEEIEEYAMQIARELQNRALAPNLKLIIFTVSPIRHFKDGAHGNQISKSSLILGLDNFINRCNSNTEIIYFPSYEILLDELRDYRYFAEDLVHPSDTAVKYIFEKFVDGYFKKGIDTKMKMAEKITLAQNHRPFNCKSESYAQFLSNLAKLKSEFEKA